MDMKLEILFVPVSDVDRAKHFYEKLGFRLDIDYVANEDFRAIQFTPPGGDEREDAKSKNSLLIQFNVPLTSAKNLLL